MTDKDFFDELVKRGIITKEVSEKTLVKASSSSRLPEEVLYDEKLAEEDVLSKIKSEMTGAPVKRIDPGKITDDILGLIPRHTARSFRMIPIEKKDQMLVVGMFRPYDSQAQEALRFVAKQQRVNLGVYIITYSDLNNVWKRYNTFKSDLELAIQEVGVRSKKGEGELVSLEQEVAGAQVDAPIIKIVSMILMRAVEVRASDIHIEPQKGRLRVRFRIDGELEEVTSIPSELSQPIISRVKVLSRLRLDENRIPQDGRFRTIIFGKEIDYRVASFPTPNGEKVVIRVLDSSEGLKGLKNLGLSEYNVAKLEKALAAPYGMILITGPTGSGKSTTLYGILQKMNTENVNIITLEDPVEYFMDGVNQSQVKPEIGYDFAAGLRQILRQDPDIIMVGEIRDAETANLAINAALTGHIVLSTLHTNNAMGVIPRLTDLGAPAFLISSALHLMLGQRLVPVLCPNCKSAKVAPPEAQKEIEESIAVMPESLQKMVREKFEKPYKVYEVKKNESCTICKGKGVYGRTAIMEIFEMTSQLEEIIASGFSEVRLQEEAKRQEMITLRSDGIVKALEGTISLDSVLEETTK